MEIGSHGMRHRRWRGLDDAALHEEHFEAKRIIEQIVERPVTEAACPFGSYDRRVVRSLRRAGFRRVYTSDRGTARMRDFVQARTSVGPHDEPSLIDGIAAPPTPHRAAVRRAKLAVKRWR
jgi:peptidoglycan/xylan/chitin deacetylase (PgdA/CDA1 family)